MTFKFEGLAVWQAALEYVDTAYKIVELLPSHEAFNLNSQLRRSATSIALNIAEGSTAQTDAEQARFLGLAISSLIETVACQRLITRRNYRIQQGLLTALDTQAQSLARQLHALRRSLDPERKWLREDAEPYNPNSFDNLALSE